MGNHSKKNLFGFLMLAAMATGLASTLFVTNASADERHGDRRDRGDRRGDDRYDRPGRGPGHGGPGGPGHGGPGRPGPGRPGGGHGPGHGGGHGPGHGPYYPPPPPPPPPYRPPPHRPPPVPPSYRTYNLGWTDLFSKHRVEQKVIHVRGMGYFTGLQVMAYDDDVRISSMEIHFIDGGYQYVGSIDINERQSATLYFDASPYGRYDRNREVSYIVISAKSSNLIGSEGRLQVSGIR